ncbi:MAG TPA: ATP-binding protein [Polyangiaceae bacterium]|jgi:PAS domain S-box-containing protein
MTSVRSLLDALPFAVGVRGLEELVRWTYVNPAMCELLGYESHAELLQTASFDVLADPSARAMAMDTRRRVLRGERNGFDLVRWRRRDGSVLPMEVSVSVIDFDGAQAIMVVGRDLSERTELRSRLAIAERMASVGTLAAGVAHEINNPLTHVILGLEHCARELRSLVEAREDDRTAALIRSLDNAREGAGRVGTIVQALKSMSRSDEDARAVLDVPAVLESAIEIVRHQILHRARLVKAFDPVPPVEASAGRLVQVFVNLLANAAQAIPVGRAEDNEIAVVTELAPSGQVVIEVRDTGSGIPLEILPRVFDPFFTTKDVGEGTGLGLSICHGIVTSLGGVITAANREGGGTVLRVALPAASRSARPPQEEARAAAPAVPRRRPRVLVVDDDPILGRACRLALQGNFDVTMVTSVGAALDHLAEEEPDAILCDLMMPVQTGMDLYTELGRTRPSLRDRIAFMTGGAFTESATAFLHTVPNLRIDKPFTGQALDALMQRMVAKRR